MRPSVCNTLQIMKPWLLYCFLTIVFLPACQKDQEKTHFSTFNIHVKSEKIQNTVIKNTATEAEQWLVQGDFQALAGSVRSGGGETSPFTAGERLLVTLHVGGMEPGTPLDAEFEIANEQGSWTGNNRQTLPAHQVRGTSGILQAVLQTKSSWPSGIYTLYVRLVGGTRRGEWFIPIAIHNDTTDVFAQNLRVHLPTYVQAGSHFAVRFSGPPGLSFTVRIDQENSVLLQLPQEKPTHFFSILTHTFVAPKTPGAHVLYVSVDRNHNKISFGEPFTVLFAGDGLFSLRIAPHDGGLRSTWKRSQEGLLWIENPQWNATDPGVLDIVVQTAREEVLYLRRMDLPAAPVGELAVPFLIPEFAPAGKLSFLLRRISKSGIQEARVELMLEGENIPISRNFTISKLDIGHHPALPIRTGPLTSGRDWHVSFVLSGYTTGQKNEIVGNKTVPVPVLGFRCTARLADLQGHTVAENRTFVSENRPQLYVAPRYRVNAVWSVPRLVPGRYFFYIECDDTHSQGSAQLQRLVDVH